MKLSPQLVMSVKKKNNLQMKPFEVSLNSKAILTQFAELVQFAKSTRLVHLAQFDKFFSSYR